MATKPAKSDIKAGSFAGFDKDNIKSVALVVETSSNSYEDGSTEEFALIAVLPLAQVPMDSLFPYGTDPNEAPPEVTSSTSDTASGLA